MVQRAIDRGHTVTLFNRGNKDERFPDLEQLVGDRDRQLPALAGRHWDAVVDTSGYVPRHVDDSARLLKAGGTPHYLFISTVAVYEPQAGAGIDENSTLTTLADPTVEVVNGETYGPLKALCEEAVNRHYPGAATILRPTFIIGPGDSTDRFSHYLERPLAGGKMAAPAPLAYVDVRDLAEFTVMALERQITGRYNMVNAPGAANHGQMMQRSLAASGAEVELSWISYEFLHANDLIGDGKPGFPMIVDPVTYGGMRQFSQAAAVARGFSNRPFADTFDAHWNWWSALPAERRAGRRIVLPLDVEQAWLAAKDASNSASTG
jgi:2'-hydroxyisoflavone reductase